MSSETIEFSNPTDRAQRFTIEGTKYEVPAHGTIELPLRMFRAVLTVLCDEPICREIGFCTRAHEGSVFGGLAPALTYEPRKEERR